MSSGLHGPDWTAGPARRCRAAATASRTACSGCIPADSATVVRAFHPDAVEAQRGTPGRRRADAAVHDGGLFEAARAVSPASPGTACASARRQPSGRRRTRTASCRRSASSTCISSARARTASSGAGSALASSSTRACSGTAFAVWAPNARGMHLVSDANYWDARTWPMRALGAIGRVGAVRAQRRSRHEVQVPGHAAPTASRCSRQTRWPAPPSGPRPPRASSTSVAVSRGMTAHGCGSAARGEPAAVAAGRSTRCTSAPGSAASSNALLSYRELAQRLAEHCNATGFTHVELLPVMEHPFGGSWGYQVTGYYAPTARFGAPDDFRFLRRPPAPAGHRRHPRLGARPLPARRLGAGAIRRHRRCTSTPIRAGASIPTGARTSSTTGATRCATSSWPTRATGRRSSTRTGCASTPWRRCCTSTTRAGPGEWLPNRHGGRENLEAIALLREVNEQLPRDYPGVITVAEESTAWPGVSRPVARRRSRLHVQMEHGLDARHARLHGAGPGLPPLSTTRRSRSACGTRGRRTSSCRCRTTRWCT